MQIIVTLLRLPPRVLYCNFIINICYKVISSTTETIVA